MNNKKIDLTQLCALEEIRHILLESEEDRENIVIQDPVYQQQIFRYVLENLKHRYLELENFTEIPQKASDIIPPCPIGEKTLIRQLLHVEMYNIMRSRLEQRGEKETNRIRTGESK